MSEIRTTEFTSKKMLLGYLSRFGILDCEISVGESKKYRNFEIKRPDVRKYVITEEIKTLQEIQKELDEKKYFESQIAKQDLSGKMDYCKQCDLCYHALMQCQLSNDSRVINCVCAKAYNKMKK